MDAKCPNCDQAILPAWRACPHCTADLSGKERDIGVTAPGEPEKTELQSLYTDSWAVVIGINDYRLVPALAYAIPDAEDVSTALIDVGFDRRRITTLLDSEATRQNIQDVLSVDMAERTGKNDRLFVFFAGHGHDSPAPSGRPMGYIMPFDGDPRYLASRCIPMNEVETWNELIPAKHILYVMDCCYSGLAATRSAGLSIAISAGSRARGTVACSSERTP